MDKHVMISYNQSSAIDLARKINSQLKDNNMKTWIDFEKMNSSLNSDMSQAIDNAFVVLVFVTDEYLQSSNCQRECEYADRHKKPIIPIKVNTTCDPSRAQGPIPFIVGGLLYEDFSNPLIFSSKFNDLLTRIRKLQNSQTQSQTQSNVQPQPQPQSNVQPQPQARQYVDVPELVTLCDDSNNNYQQIERLIRQLNANVNYKNHLGRTGLICASKNGHIDIVKLLVENGADPNITDKKNFNSLIEASMKNHTTIARLLIEYGANVNYKIDKENDVFFNGYTALMFASSYGSLDTVKLLVEKGAIVNEKDKDGETALMKGCRSSHVDVVRFLLDSGADIHDRDKRGASAIINATVLFYDPIVPKDISPRMNTIKLLLERGANVNDHDNKGWTPIKYCQFFKEVVDYLKSKGAIGGAESNDDKGGCCIS